ncbi:mechanosensitive ion channel family protein [Fulvivirga maritima]|uniref:mechanosensitive ion channel family protein n=1 Tax=Fulvivirga maritima TaxID=2904247 RepID=UPI001F21AFB8|nr:mechanosensitive ion channel domain-containing protein [Fulvivirga maritima]UII24769.1 mechanosensitive ion channel family protein [Fulvivirga maritima]
MKERVFNAFAHFWESIIDRVPEISIGVIMLVFFTITGVMLRRFTQRRLLKRLGDQLLANFIGRIIFLVFLVIGIVIFRNQLGLSRAAGGLLAGAGVSALIIGFAFKDIGENFLSGFFLAFSRPFRIGDIIQVDSFTGTVRALSFRNTHIRTFDGRDIFIPNSILIKQPLTNFTRDGLMRHDFIVGLDYGDDIARATTVILDELSKMQNITTAEGVEPFVIINDFGTSTINLKIHFWINTYDFLGSTTVLKSTVMHQVVNRLISEGFNMPADIIELKIYQEGQPIPVAVKGRP